MHDVAAFRAAYRARAIGPRYSGWGHFAFLTTVCGGAIAFCLSRLRSVTLPELSTVLCTFFFANAVEYFGHQGPMHHPIRWLRAIHRRHTLDHHHFFTHDAMACESSRDFQIMLFPPALLVFFLGGIALPAGLLLRALFSPNVAWLFAATAVSYYLTYEWLHFAYHLPASTWVGRRALVRVLRRHHQTHHDLSAMGKWNFNITFPICDLLFRTSR